jgi:hypothetical protein
MRPAVIAVIVAVTFSMPQVGYVARAPDITNQRFQLHNASAFADFLGSGRFPLSQAAEHTAMPTHDAALRDASGLLSELEAKTSTAAMVTVSWDGNVLWMDGYVADITTAFPHMDMPRWSFQSPQFLMTAVPRSWKDLFVKLLELPATKAANGESRTIDFFIEEDQRAVITLYQLNTFDLNNQPVERWSIVVAFGPVIPAQMPDDRAPPAPRKKSGC